jgi:hypothetical protein
MSEDEAADLNELATYFAALTSWSLSDQYRYQVAPIRHAAASLASYRLDEADDEDLDEDSLGDGWEQNTMIAAGGDRLGDDEDEEEDLNYELDDDADLEDDLDDDLDDELNMDSDEDWDDELEDDLDDEEDWDEDLDDDFDEGEDEEWEDLDEDEDDSRIGAAVGNAPYIVPVPTAPPYRPEAATDLPPGHDLADGKCKRCGCTAAAIASFRFQCRPATQSAGPAYDSLDPDASSQPLALSMSEPIRILGPNKERCGRDDDGDWRFVFSLNRGPDRAWKTLWDTRSGTKSHMAFPILDQMYLYCDPPQLRAAVEWLKQEIEAVNSRVAAEHERQLVNSVLDELEF